MPREWCTRSSGEDSVLSVPCVGVCRSLEKNVGGAAIGSAANPLVFPKETVHSVVVLIL